MKTWRLMLGLICLLCILAMVACEPEKTRVVWSPDGAQALVILPDGLHLCDPEGKLSPVLIAAGPEKGEISYAEWLPDSRHIVVLRDEPLKSWTQVTILISEPTRQAIMELAAKVKTSALAYQGDWEKFGDTLTQTQDEKLMARYGTAVALYLYDQNDPALRTKLGAAWDKGLGPAQVASTVIQSYEVTPTQAKPGTILLQWAVEQSALRLRISPTGKYVAVSYVTSAYGTDHDTSKASSPSCTLGVIPTDGSGPFQQISELSSLFVDWTPDERYLVFGRTDVPEPLQKPEGQEGDGQKSEDRARLGVLARHRITDLEGKPPAEFHNEDLVTILYSPTMRVRCLADGRILFSGTEVHLPATPGEMSDQQSIFVLDSAKQANVTNLIPPSALAKAGGLTEYFEVSPNQKYISLLGKKGEVRIITLATGEITDCQKDEVRGQTEEHDPKPRIVPQWRTPDQLTYVIPLKDPKPGQPVAEVVLRNATASEWKSLSAHWPAASVEGFLIAPPEAPPTTPATTPATQP